MFVEGNGTCVPLSSTMSQATSTKHLAKHFPSISQAFQNHLYYQWLFQVPKFEVPTIHKAFFSGLNFREYRKKGQTFLVQYLQFRKMVGKNPEGPYPCIPRKKCWMMLDVPQVNSQIAQRLTHHFTPRHVPSDRGVLLQHRLCGAIRCLCLWRKDHEAWSIAEPPMKFPVTQKEPKKKSIEI